MDAELPELTQAGEIGKGVAAGKRASTQTYQERKTEGQKQKGPPISQQPFECLDFAF
jgi:hypothetical protein